MGHASVADIVKQLLQHIHAGHTSMHNTSGIFQHVCQSMQHWAETCVAVQGQHFEHLL
jgi:hypothetical protein